MAETSPISEHVSITAQRYDAFISYSHEADTRLAAALETLLEQLAKPWYRLRAANVFRDETALTASPHLWPNIKSRLQDSRFLILLASTTSAHSKWVEKELCCWITGGACDEPKLLRAELVQPSRVEHLFIVLTEGDIAWDDTAASNGNGNFDWQKTSALPELLSNVFVGEPLWVDLRWARKNLQARLDRSNPEFIKAVARLSAPIREIEIETLIGDDYRQQRRALALFRGLTFGLTIALLLAIGLGIWAMRSRWQAKQSEAKAQEFGIWAKDEAIKKTQKAAELQTEQGNNAERRLARVEAMHHFAQAIAEQETEIMDPTERKQAEEADALRAFSSASGFYGTREGIKNYRGAKKPDSSGRVRLGLLEPSYYLSKIVDDNSSIISPFDIRRNDIGGGGYFFQTNPRLVRRLNDIPGAEAAWLRMQKSDGLWKLENRTTDLERIFYQDRYLALRTDDVLMTHLSALDAEVEKLLEKSTDPNRDKALANVVDQSRTKGNPDIKLAHMAATAAFSVDGGKIVTAGYDGNALVWSADNGQELYRLVGHKGALYWAEFDMTGQRVVTAGSDGTARIWDLSVTPPSDLQLIGHQDKLRCAEFSDDGKFALTASDDKTIRLWSTKDGKQYRSFPTGADNVLFAKLSKDARKVLSVTSQSAKIWDVEERMLIAELGPHKDRLFAASASENFDTIETRSWDHEIRIWREQQLPNSHPLVIADENSKEGYHDNSTLFFATDSTQRIVTYSEDLQTHKAMLRVSRVGGDAHELQHEFSLSTDDLPLAAPGESIQGLTVGQTCDRIVVQLTDQLVVLKRHDNRWERELSLPDKASTRWKLKRISRDQNWFVFQRNLDLIAFPFNRPDNASPATRVYDSNSSSTLAHIKFEQFDLNNDSTQLAYVLLEDDDRRHLYLRNLDPKTLQPTKGDATVFRGGDHRYLVNSCKFQSDHLLTASWDRTAKLWDVAKPDSEPIVFFHPEPVDDAALSPDGKLVATGSWDKKARVWDVEDQRLMAEFEHPGRVMQVEFFSNQNHRWLLTACSDGQFRLWPLKAIDGDAKYLTLWAEILTGTEMGPSGLMALSSSEWKRKCREGSSVSNSVPNSQAVDRLSP